MQDSDSKSLERVLAQQKQKEIAADDYSHKIENWLRLADQMLGVQATHGTPGPAAGNRPQATAEKTLSQESRQSNANQKRSR